MKMSLLVKKQPMIRLNFELRWLLDEDEPISEEASCDKAEFWTLVIPFHEGKPIGDEASCDKVEFWT